MIIVDSSLEQVEDIQEEIMMESNHKESQRYPNEAVAETNLNNPAQISYPVAGVEDNLLMSDNNYVGNQGNQMNIKYNNFYHKYLRQKRKNSQLHVITAYKIYKEEFNNKRTDMNCLNEQRITERLSDYIYGVNLAMQHNYYS